MGHTNSTTNLALPQFIGTDKPTWLGDINGAFSAIDAYAGTNDAAVTAAASDASSAITQASAAVNTANAANTTAGNASTAANNAIGVANTANAIAGTVDTKVGLLANLNTTDRTSIVNAINEVATYSEHGIREVYQLAPYAELEAGSITVDGDYDAFIIELATVVNATTAVESQTITVESEGSAALTEMFPSNGIIVFRRRDVSLTKAGTVNTFTFTDCDQYDLTTYGTQPAPVTYNRALTPIRIMGIIHNN